MTPALLNLSEAFGRDVRGRIVLRQKVHKAILAAMAGIARGAVQSRILKEWSGPAELVSRLAGYYCLENRLPSNGRPIRTAINERWHATLAQVIAEQMAPGGHRSNTIALAHDARHARPPSRLAEAIPDFCLFGREQAHGDPTRFNPVVANHLHDGAGGSVEDG